MKILHVLYQSLPNTAGSSIRSRDLINSQLKNGITPIVITSPFQAPFNKGCKKEIIDNVTYYRTFSKSQDEIISEEKSNIFVQIKKAFRLISFTYDVYYIANQEKVDVIHAHAMFFCAISAKLTSLMLKIPCVYEVRSLWEERYKYSSLFSKIIFSFATIIESYSMWISDCLIVINDNLKFNISNRFFLKKKKINIVNNAVDLNRIKIINIKRKNIVFGYIGTLSPIEGLDLLIKAFNNLYSNNIQNRLLIYGDGIELGKLKYLAISNPLVEFKGKFTQNKISEVYSTIDVVINPRISNYLTNSVTPLKPLEAMAYRKLVLASNVGGMKELIEHNKTGYLFQSDSTKSIEKIVRDVASTNDFDHIVENAHKYILSDRSWQANAKIYYKLYNNLINE